MSKLKRNGYLSKQGTEEVSLKRKKKAVLETKKVMKRGGKVKIERKKLQAKTGY